jgi:hypothetical protein
MISCKNASTKEIKIDSFILIGEVTEDNLAIAKQLQLKILEYEEHAFSQMITAKEFDRKAKPLQLKLDSISNLLPPTDRLILNRYNEKLLEERLKDGETNKD